MIVTKEIRPIRSEADYDAVIAEIEDLFGAPSGTPEGDRLDVLVTLAEAYEARHHAIEPPDPIEAILYAVEQRGLTRRDLEPMIGERGRVSEVLNRRRRLTIGMIQRLHAELGIPAHVLIQPYEIAIRPRSRESETSAKASLGV